MSRSTSNSIITLVAVLLPLVKLKPNISGINPFEDDVEIMLKFVIAMLVFAITQCINKSYSNDIITGYISFVSGGLAAALLAFILLKDERLGLLPILFWFAFFVKLTYDLCRKLSQRYNEISSSSHFLKQMIHWRRSYQNEGGTQDSRGIGNPPHVILCFVMGTLIALMALKFGSTDIGGGMTISVFVITVFVYALTWAIQTKLQTGNPNDSSHHLIIAGKISFLLGSLSSVWLLLILFPRLGYGSLFIWIFFLFKLIYEAYQKLHQMYQEVSSFNQLFGPISFVWGRLYQLLNTICCGYRHEGRRLPV